MKLFLTSVVAVFYLLFLGGCQTVDPVIESSSQSVNESDIELTPCDNSGSFDCDEVITLEIALEHVPDAQFKACLTENGERPEQVKSLFCDGYGIKTLEGIDQFLNISNLFLSNNELANVDLHKLSKLHTLHLEDNEITKLSLPESVERVFVNSNQLTGFQTHHLGNLRTLHVNDNRLDFFVAPPALVELEARKNQLREVELGKAIKLEELNLGENQLVSLNLNRNLELSTVWVDSNFLTHLNLRKNTLLKNAHASNNQINHVVLKQNLSLARLWLNNNQIQEIDLSYARNLIWLELEGNQLTGIPLGLATLENKAAKLYLSQNPWSSEQLAKLEKLRSRFRLLKY